MSIGRTFSLVLLVIASFAIVKFAASAISSQSEYRTVSQLGDAAAATTTWMNGTVALSLERSVSQVALSLSDPAPAEFRSLVDQQRKLSNERLDAAIATIESFHWLETKDDFLTAVRSARANVEKIRGEIDALLSIAKVDRDEEQAEKLPFDLKTEISSMKNEADLLSLASDVPTVKGDVLASIQQRAWEVREFGGRARTYYAIATLNGENIAHKERGIVIADSARAYDAWSSVQAAARADELPQALREQIGRAEPAYFNEYLGLLGELDAAMAASNGFGAVDFPVSFDEFFDRSNAALNLMSGLSEDAGAAAVAYWEQRKSSAFTDLVVNIGLLAVLLAVLITSMVFVSRRIVRPLHAFRDAVSKLANGEHVALPGVDRSDEIGALARSMGEIHERGVEAARIRVALDSSSSMTMLADNEFNIVYLNAPLSTLLAEAER